MANAMPITPRFTVDQTDEEVLVKINVPYVRVSQAEVVASSHDFTFYCKPYFLKLTFPHEVVDDDRCRAVYDPNIDHGLITAHLPKLVPGQHFPDLDMVSKLLQNRITKDNKEWSPPLIEVVGETVNDVDSASELGKDALPNIDSGEVNVRMTPMYGFNNLYSKVLGNLRDELSGVVSLPLPDLCAMSNRRFARMQAEAQQFDADRYLADLLHADEDYIYTEAMRHHAHWDVSWEMWKSAERDEAVATAEACVHFSEENNATMTNLPRRSSLYHASALSTLEKKQIIFTLIDILCAYCYDYRITQSEPTVESATNITLLSASLSWLEVFSEDDDMLSVLVTSARRVMCNGYLRVWKLIRKVFVDVTKILLLGKRCVLKCLLDLHHIIEHTDTHYILNKLFINDYCIWLQTADLGDMLQVYGHAMNTAKKDIDYNMLDFGLKEIEKCLTEGASEEESESGDDSERDFDEDNDTDESMNDAAGQVNDNSNSRSVAVAAEHLKKLELGTTHDLQKKVLIEEIE